ncbi:hypothetical protein [Nitratireductor soli]|uniref:hypothetical protein n=1 Tax=Nitratireductor soli TaxID=1670619 RepID=UPI00065E3FB3|nr:hypothetical protein [Nitratireductor soli]
MKFNRHGRIFQVAALGLLLTCQAGALAGCMSASLEDAAPVATLPAPANTAPANTAETNAAPIAGARLTGEYPNLNVAPDSAATPITAGEKETLTRDLTATRKRLGASTPSGNPAAEADRLRKLAKTHAQRRLEEIERGE